MALCACVYVCVCVYMCVCVTHGLTHIRDIVVASFSLLLLKLDRYSPNWTLLDAPHQMSDETTWGVCSNKK